MALHLTSTAFKDGGEIPAHFTCDGANVSPPLAWSGVPANAKSLVLIVDDPDAPDPRAPRMTWVHWVVYDLPADSTGLPEGTTRLPPPAHGGINDSGGTNYDGPCPPTGRHRYFFKLYALDKTLGDLGKTNKARVEQAMAGHVVAQAQIMGTCQRQR